MLELEASLYSMVHYAEDLSSVGDSLQKIDHKDNGCVQDYDDTILSEKDIDLSHNRTSENENISTSIFNEIMNAKKTAHPSTSDLLSDSGMSSDQDISYTLKSK